MLAEFCRRMGHDPGGHWDETADCGREDPLAAEIQARLLSDDPRLLDMGRRAIRSVDQAVVKNCMLFREPEKLLDPWLGAWPGLHIVALWRDPLAQFESWDRKLTLEGFPGEFRKRQPPAATFCVERERERAEFGASCDRRGVPLAWMEYPDFLYDVAAVLRALAPLDLDPGHAIATWAELVDHNKIHCEGSAECISPASAQPTGALA